MCQKIFTLKIKDQNHDQYLKHVFYNECLLFAQPPIPPAHRADVYGNWFKIYSRGRALNSNIDRTLTHLATIVSIRFFLLYTFELVEQIIAEFGTDHVYNCDVFNEVRPTHSDPDFVASVGSTVYNAMAHSDPEAIWYYIYIKTT